MQRVGSGEGITFDFNGRTGNSKMSHRLMCLAGSTSSEVQTKLAEELFRGHFEERKDIADEEVLLDAAVQAGLDKEIARGFLESAQVQDKVEEEVESVRETGVRGVPHIILDEKHHFDGAVDVGDLFEAFVNIKEGLAI
jgi:predicted DsbA family dithiol-disulfide isomerase